MVKGISRQVIVVHAPEPKLFEQAIFILKDGALEHSGVTDEELLQEAKRVLRSQSGSEKGKRPYMGFLWAASGAMLTGLIWLLTVVL